MVITGPSSPSSITTIVIQEHSKEPSLNLVACHEYVYKGALWLIMELPLVSFCFIIRLAIEFVDWLFGQIDSVDDQAAGTVAAHAQGTQQCTPNRISLTLPMSITL
jgi:hypothetical protein